MIKIFNNKSFIQKIIIALIIILLFNLTVPLCSQASDERWGIMGSLLKELMKLIQSLGDITLGALNKMMLGTDKILGSVMLTSDDPNLTDDQSNVYADPNSNPDDTINANEDLDDNLWGGENWKIPNILYSPESIFANKIAALDVNFVNPNTYTPAQEGSSKANQAAVSSATQLRETISKWYQSFRSIAIVGLLSVLVYIGIRILISSTSQDKAKYKENLKDWLVALCLVVTIHLIMAATMKITELVTDLFGSSADKGIVIQVTNSNIGDFKFKTNFTGYMRFMAQSNNYGNVTAYTIIYVSFVIYTVMFTFIYLRRFLYMAFFTMIAPLVALTYPIDKLGDGKAQAFNMWFKEYTMNAIIQPIHLLLFTVLISSAKDLAINNPIYALVAIAFLIPAEKFIKGMFKLDQAKTPEGLGGFAGGALAMQGLQKLSNSVGNGAKKSNKSSEGNDKVRTTENPELPESEHKNLDSWKDDNAQGKSNNQDDDNIYKPSSGANDSYDEYGNNVGQGENSGAMPYASDEDQGYDDNISNNSVYGEDNGEELDSGTSQTGNRRIPQSNNLGETNRSNQLTPQRGRFKSGLETAKHHIIKGAKTGAKYTGKKILGLGKGLGKGVLRTAVSAPTAVLAGTIGLAAGLTTGDFSKAAQYTTAGLAAGGAFGNKIFGNAAVNGVSQLPSDVRSIRSTYREQRGGLGYERQLRMQEESKKAEKKFMKDETEKQRSKDIAAKIQQKTGKEYSAEQITKARLDYKKAGIDDKHIEKGIMMEAKRGDVGGENHGKMINLMQEVGDYSKEYIEDSKKRKILEDRINGSLGEEKGKEFMETFAEAHDRLPEYQRIKAREKEQARLAAANAETSEKNSGKNKSTHNGRTRNQQTHDRTQRAQDVIRQNRERAEQQSIENRNGYNNIQSRRRRKK